VSTATTDQREILTWSDFGDAVRDLAHDVAASGFAPDLVLSVARGGLGLGMSLGYALDVKATACVNVEFYTGVDARLPAPVLVAPTPAASDLDGLRVLVVDDVADTGHTLRHVLDHCAGHAVEVRIAVVYAKPRSVVVPDYAWRQTDAWIEFPWSDPPVTGSAARSAVPRLDVG